MRTNCFEIFSLMKKSFVDSKGKEIILVTDLYYILNVLKVEIKDTFDGQEYELTLKPKRDDSPIIGRGNERFASLGFISNVRSAAASDNENREETKEEEKQKVIHTARG